MTGSCWAKREMDVSAAADVLRHGRRNDVAGISLSDAERPAQDIWVDGDGECPLTIELHVADEYTIHVTAPRNTSFQFVLTAFVKHPARTV